MAGRYMSIVAKPSREEIGEALRDWFVAHKRTALRFTELDDSVSPPVERQFTAKFYSIRESENGSFKVQAETQYDGDVVWRLSEFVLLP